RAALGMLRGTVLVKRERLAPARIVGELSLDGRVRPVRGVLPVALHCRQQGFGPLVVPAENAAEASVVERLDVIPVATMLEAVEYLNGVRAVEPIRTDVTGWLENRPQ